MPRVQDLLDVLTVEEMSEWQAFFELEPWGYRTENRRLGVVTATLANFIGGLGSEHALKPDDVFPPRPSAGQAPTLASMKAFGILLGSICEN